MNQFIELGGYFFFEFIEDERCMQFELLEVMGKFELDILLYICMVGFGLCVFNYMDYKGDFVNGMGGFFGFDIMGIILEFNGIVDFNDFNSFWCDDDYSGCQFLDFKEEDEYDMDFVNQ